jgi:hypothetical protein
MKRKRHFILPGIAVAVTVLATPVIAAIQIFSVDYGAFSSPLPIGSSEGLDLVQFDPSRGTLTGVTLTLSSFDTVVSEVYNPGGVSTAYTGATAKMPITVSALGGLTTTAAGNAGPFAGVSTGPGISVAGTAPIISLQNTVSVSPMDFGFYEGADALSFTVTVDSSVESFSGSSSSPLFFGGNGFSYGNVAIEYTYCAVPEPGTTCAGLAAMGICGIELARRIRRLRSRGDA